MRDATKVERRSFVMTIRLTLVAAVVALSGCAHAQEAGTPSSSIGPQPALPPPQKQMVPTVNNAPAKGWPDGARPVPARGTQVNAFARDLQHPRWVHVLPNGDVLVAESNAPPPPKDAKKGVKKWVMGKVMKRAGAAVPSPNRITLLRDADGDGTAETRSALLENLNSPFGMALVGERLYVANADGIVRFPFKPGQTKVDAAPEKVTDLPAGINHHWTKNILASPDGRRLYATVGSNSNVAEGGMGIEEGRAAIWEVDLGSGQKRLYASGLRNPNGLAWEPGSGALWTVVNERDELGNDLVPDYLTAVRDGGFYGWPYSYWGGHVDERVKPQRPDLVAKALAPDFALGSHVAPLGLAWSEKAALPAPFTEGMFIGLHGSWNRKELAGYKVVFVPFAQGRPAGGMVDLLTGFVSEDGDAYGRPVGVAVDSRGAVLVADDVGNTIWRITSAAPG
jgi:glucose/arabinose dehydrogenase